MKENSHIRAECANTLQKKNKSPNAMWSDEDFDCSNDDDNFLAFASKIDNTGAIETESSSRVPSGVPSGVPILSYESNDGEDLTKEALIQAFMLLHTK